MSRPTAPLQHRKEPYNTRLPRWLCEWLRERENAAVTIEEALIKQHNLERPE